VIGAMKTVMNVSSALSLSLLLTACATPEPREARIDRLSPEQLAALSVNPDKARDATRLTEQADREAAQVRARQALLERERGLELRRQREWDLRYGQYGHPGFWSFGPGYRGPAASWRYGIGF